MPTGIVDSGLVGISGLKPKVYLCGGINGLSDGDCNDWRLRAKGLVKAECVDPMIRDYRGKEDANFRDIVVNDKRDIDSCEVLLVNAARPSWGTAMEMLYAWERSRQVYAFVEPGKPVSPWVRYHSLMVFESMEEAIDALNRNLQNVRI